MSGTAKIIEREPASPGRAVIDPSGWTADRMERSGDWILHLSDSEIADLDRAIRGVETRGLDIMDISRENFALPVLGGRLAQVRHMLLDGPGLVLVRGFPVARYSRAQAASAFFGIGRYLGRALSQNAKGHVLGHVKKLTDVDYNKDPRERGYRTGVMQRFHADSCDIVGLMCLQTARSGGLSSIVSTVTVHNVMLERRPDLVAELAAPLYWDRRGEIPEGRDPWYVTPVFNYHQGYFSCRYARQYIDSAQRFDQVPRFTQLQLEALDMMDALLAELHMKTGFQQGDIQFLHNHVTLHGRSAFEDYDEPDRKRHLFRLWLSTDGARPIPPMLAERTAGGVINHQGHRAERAAGGCVGGGGVGLAAQLSDPSENFLETFEAGRPQINVFRGSRIGMGLAEGVGLGPVREMLPAAPHRMGRIQRMVLGLGPAQQIKPLEPGNPRKMAVPLRPDPLKLSLPSLDDPKAVHGNKHGFLSD